MSQQNIKTHLIDSIESFDKLAKNVLTPLPPLVYFDCEGSDLSREGQLCAIQIGVPNPNEKQEMTVLIIDIVQAGKDIIENVRELLESTTTLKVIHDAKRDSEALFWQFNVTLNHVFDTQIAWTQLKKHELIENGKAEKIKEDLKQDMKEQKDDVQQEKKEEEICPQVELVTDLIQQISFVDLLKEYVGIDYYQKPLLHDEVEEGLWLKRPLDKRLIESAVLDVQYLHPLYETLKKKISELKNKDEMEEYIYQYSNLWLHAYRKHDIKSSFCRTTFVDIALPQKSTLNCIMRVVRTPSPEVMKIIVGAKGRNIISMKNINLDCYIFTAGQRGPKEFLFIMGKKERVEEIYKLLPNFLYEMFTDAMDIFVMFKHEGGYAKKVNAKTGATIMKGEAFGDMTKFSIVGTEEQVQAAIEMINKRLDI